MNPPIITMEQLRRKAGWERITQHTGSYEAGGVSYTVRRFSLQPSRPTWPTIDLHFDDQFSRLDPLGFSHWHAHYDGWANPRRNLVVALRAVRALVAQRLVLIEHLDEAGKYWGGELVAPGGIPGTLSKNIKRFRRVHFDREPETEDVDLSRYWEGKHLLVEWKYKKETERLWRENDVPIMW